MILLADDRGSSILKQNGSPWKQGLSDRIGEQMEIRPLGQKDRVRLHSMLTSTQVFTSGEIDVAMELIDVVLKDRNQKDYEIYCMVDDEDQLLGYICYGPTPMTQGAFDLYWIAVDRRYQGQGIGSRLLDFLEEGIKERKGRMILVDTSSIAEYEKTQKFYFRKGFHEVARVPDYYWPGNDRVTFCKKLS
jgi:ribosomal protein S18 acetylase RimI-like enzyme